MADAADMARSTVETVVHPAAVIEPGATLGPGCRIGPFCHVGPEVVLGSEVVLESHVVVAGRTRIGDATHVFPFAALGHAPQDLKYHGEASELIIGARNTIREHVTMNPGTEGGGMVTRIGAGGLYMVGAHIAHDCQVGDGVILANNATLAGHVTIGDHAIIGGLSAVHQFVRIGAHAMIGGMTGVERDVIPFGLVMGDRGALAGLNLVGLKRRGFPRETIDRLRAAYRTLFDSTSGATFDSRVTALAETAEDDPALAALMAFLRSDTTRKVLQPRDRDDTGGA